MESILRLGVVGVGALGQHHVRILSAMEGVQLVGIADVNKERLKDISETYHVPAFKNCEDLLGKVDAVTIVVPTTKHYSVGKLFLENGIHTLVEKPITSTLKQATELVALAKEKKAILQIGHVERFNSAVMKLQEYLKAPMFIESHRLSSFTPRVKDVGVVLDLMIHDIDIILTVVPSKLVKIEAVGVSVLTRYEDLANARLTFANGCIANLTASRIANNRMRKIRIFQADAYFSLDYVKPELEIYRRVVTPQGWSIESIQHKFEANEALQKELASFVTSVRKGIPPVVTGEHGQDALEVALEITKQIADLNAKYNNPIVK